MTATDELRRMLDERGVKWKAGESEIDHVTMWKANGGHAEFYESKTTNPDLLQVNYYNLTPEQAIAATVGNDGAGRSYDRAERSSDGVAERIKSVYLVMVADDLLEDGTPLCAYRDVPSAEQRASRERCVDEDGVRHYAWVTEVKVVGE